MSIYNDDELVAPSWINHEFLQKVLREYENDEDIEVSLREWMIFYNNFICISIDFIGY